MHVLGNRSFSSERAYPDQRNNTSIYDVVVGHCRTVATNEKASSGLPFNAPLRQRRRRNASIRMRTLLQVASSFGVNTVQVTPHRSARATKLKNRLTRTGCHSASIAIVTPLASTTMGSVRFVDEDLIDPQAGYTCL